jgi:hypothetical protein
MSLIATLLQTPARLSTASRYTAFNGWIYLSAGALLIAWPGMTQMLFMERAFIGNEEALMRVVGLTLVVVGWLYYFGGRTGAPSVTAASIVDRLIFVPAVLVPLAVAGVFPHLLAAFAILDPVLAVTAWVLLRRDETMRES